MMSTKKIEKETEVDMRGRTEGTKRFWFAKGNPGGPGRPKGSKSLKEFAREYLMTLDDDKKIEYLDSLSPELIWRMAEGNPHSTEDVKHTIAPTPIMELGLVDSKPAVLPNAEHDTLAVSSVDNTKADGGTPTMSGASPNAPI